MLKIKTTVGHRPRTYQFPLLAPGDNKHSKQHAGKAREENGLLCIKAVSEVITGQTGTFSEPFNFIRTRRLFMLMDKEDLTVSESTESIQ